MGSIKLDKSQNIYIDTSIYIYFFEDNPKFGSIAEEIFTQIIEKQICIFASELIFTELLVTPIKSKFQPLIDLYSSLESVIPSFNSIPLNRDIAISAANIRALYGLRTPDAIHAATAVSKQVDLFIHSDKTFLNVKGLKSIDITRL